MEELAGREHTYGCIADLHWSERAYLALALLDPLLTGLGGRQAGLIVADIEVVCKALTFCMLSHPKLVLQQKSHSDRVNKRMRVVRLKNFS